MKSLMLALSLVFASVAQASPTVFYLSDVENSVEFIKAHGFDIYGNQDAGTQRQQQQVAQPPTPVADGCYYFHQTLELWSYKETFNVADVLASGVIQSARGESPVLALGRNTQNPLVRHVLSLPASGEFTVTCTMNGGKVNGLPTRQGYRRSIGLDQQCMEDCNRNGVTYCETVCARTEAVICQAPGQVLYSGYCQVE